MPTKVTIPMFTLLCYQSDYLLLHLCAFTFPLWLIWPSCPPSDRNRRQETPPTTAAPPVPATECDLFAGTKCPPYMAIIALATVIYMIVVGGKRQAQKCLHRSNKIYDGDSGHSVLNNNHVHVNARNKVSTTKDVNFRCQNVTYWHQWDRQPTRQQREKDAENVLRDSDHDDIRDSSGRGETITTGIIGGDVNSCDQCRAPYCANPFHHWAAHPYLSLSLCGNCHSDVWNGNAMNINKVCPLPSVLFQVVRCFMLAQFRPGRDRANNITAPTARHTAHRELLAVINQRTTVGHVFLYLSRLQFYLNRIDVNLSCLYLTCVLPNLLAVRLLLFVLMFVLATLLIYNGQFKLADFPFGWQHHCKPPLTVSSSSNSANRISINNINELIANIHKTTVCNGKPNAIVIGSENSTLAPVINHLAAKRHSIYAFLNTFKSKSLHCLKLHLMLGSSVSKLSQMFRSKLLLLFVLFDSQLVQFSVASVVSVSSSIASQPEHKTYPDLNIFVGNSVQLPCDLSPPGQLDPVMEEDKADVLYSADNFPFKSAMDSSSVSSSYSSMPTSSSVASQTYASDPIQLILWYHGNDISGLPFYSIDARAKSKETHYMTRPPASNGLKDNWNNVTNASNVASQPANNTESDNLKRFVMPPYNERASFSLVQNLALLTLDSVKESDTGFYWCRVDYRWTRTTISKVYLNVLVPPKRVSIYRLMPQDNSPLPTMNAASALATPELLSSIRLVNRTSPYIHHHSSLSSLISFEYSVESSTETVSLVAQELTNSFAFLEEGFDALVACEAFGGNPVPSVSWYGRNNRKLNPQRIIVRQVYVDSASMADSVRANRTSEDGAQVANPDQKHTSGTFHSEGNNNSSSSINTSTSKSVFSIVLIQSPSRLDIGSVLRCEATNAESYKPISRYIKLDVNLRPVKAHIVDVMRDTMTAGSTVYATCLTWGSRPPAKIRWFLHKQELFDVKETIFESNSTTKSTVRFVLASFDNGKNLRCIAENPNLVSRVVPSSLPSSPLLPANLSTSNASLQHSESISKLSAHDQITLTVKFLPNVSIEVEVDSDEQQTFPRSDGTSSGQLNGPVVYSARSGQSLKLHCHVESNPEPFKVRWLQNRKEIFHNHFPNELFTFVDNNRTLLVNSAQRAHEAKYQCVAYNTLGRGDSKEILLLIWRAPRCALMSRTTIESSVHYPTNLFCQVDANPVDKLNIYWQTPQSLYLSKNGKLLRLNNDDSDAHSIAQTGDKYFLDHFDPEAEPIENEPNSNKVHYNRLTVASKGVRSRLTLVPQTMEDFGMYKCWAENSVGTNREEPCVFNLTNNAQFGLPKPVYNCKVNYTQDLASVRCEHSSTLFNRSNVHQSKLAILTANTLETDLLFHLVLNQLNSDGSIGRYSLVNQTNPIEPVFLLSSLQPNLVYQIIIYVSNLYGFSDNVTLLFETSAASNVSVSSSLTSSLSANVDWTVSSGNWNRMHESSNFMHVDGLANSGEDDDDDDDGGPIRKMDPNELHSTERDHVNDESGQSISKPDLQKQNRLEDVSASHRLLFILIAVFSVALIVFSVLLSVAIVLCVYRRKRFKSQQQQQQQQQFVTACQGGKFGDNAVQMKVANQAIAFESSKSHLYPDQETERIVPDIIPCDGLLILNNLNNLDGAHQLANVSYSGAKFGLANSSQQDSNTTPVYRDFVSLQSETSYLHLNSSEPITATAAIDSGSSSSATLEPKFLCQPNHVSIINSLNSEFITGQGNVQLVTGASTPAVSAAFANLAYPSYHSANQVQLSPIHISLSVAGNESSLDNQPLYIHQSVGQPALTNQQISCSYSISESSLSQSNNDTGESAQSKSSTSTKPLESDSISATRQTPTKFVQTTPV